MKKAFLFLTALFVAFNFSSCCSMFGGMKRSAGSYEETYQVATCGYDIVREETVIDAKSGLVEVTETKVPRMKEKTRTVHVKCPDCTRFYCPTSGCCGSGGDYIEKMVTAQPSTGSPFIGLVPTMKNLAPAE